MAPPANEFLDEGARQLVHEGDGDTGGVGPGRGAFANTTEVST